MWGVRKTAERREGDSGMSEGIQGDGTDRTHIERGDDNNCGTNCSGLSIHSVVHLQSKRCIWGRGK